MPVGGIVKWEGTFVGLGAVIGNEVNIGKKCMVGASTLTTKNVEDKTVLIAGPTEIHRLNSDQFACPHVLGYSTANYGRKSKRYFN